MLHKTLTQRRPPQASDEDGLKRLAPHLPFVDRADAQLVEDAVGTDPGYDGIGSWDKLKPAPIAKGRLGLNATITLHGKKRRTG
jgi:hypothetical protein